jgi:hypothetical protein
MGEDYFSMMANGKKVKELPSVVEEIGLKPIPYTIFSGHFNEELFMKSIDKVFDIPDEKPKIEITGQAKDGIEFIISAAEINFPNNSSRIFMYIPPKEDIFTDVTRYHKITFKNFNYSDASKLVSFYAKKLEGHGGVQRIN